jgi:hypothetical protein
MNIQREYQRQIEILKKIEECLICAYEVTEAKTHMAIACFDLVIEHHAAICALCEMELYGSMFALLRVEFEALTKGLWLNHVASAENIVKFKEGDINIGFGTFINLIEGRFGISEGILHSIKKKQYEIFSSFTHTGYQALVRRVNGTHTGAINYKEEDIVSALRHTGLFCLLAAAELSAMTNSQLIIENIMDMLHGYGD